MTLLKLLYVYSALFAFIFFSARCENGDEDAVTKMLQERISCFMVNTAAKIYRMNIENKMYDKNIIFSPMDLFSTTALAYWGATDDRVQRQLNSLLGIKTMEKFLELNPDYFSSISDQNVGITFRKNLTNFIDELTFEGDKADIYHKYYYDFVHVKLADLLRRSSKSRTVGIRSGKAIFVDVKFPLKKTFIDDVKYYYNVDVKQMEFVKMPKQSTEKINSFIKGQSYNRISDFFDKPVASMTNGVMSSSLTVMASWSKLFQPKDSYETAFHRRDGECDDCDDMDICVMMNQGMIPYYADSSIAAIALPTANLQIRMFYVVPQNNRTLSEIVSRPNKNFINNIISKVSPKLIVYQVPKMAFRGEVDQLGIIRSTGLKDVSLDGIANRLTLSIFKQKSLLEINEEGIGGCPLRRSKKMPVMHNSVDKRAIQFITDRPFLFFIYNSETKMFLFYGAVFKPTGYTDF